MLTFEWLENFFLTRLTTLLHLLAATRTRWATKRNSPLPSPDLLESRYPSFLVWSLFTPPRDKRWFWHCYYYEDYYDSRKCWLVFHFDDWFESIRLSVRCKSFHGRSFHCYILGYKMEDFVKLNGTATRGNSKDRLLIVIPSSRFVQLDACLPTPPIFIFLVSPSLLVNDIIFG